MTRCKSCKAPMHWMKVQDKRYTPLDPGKRIITNAVSLPETKKPLTIIIRTGETKKGTEIDEQKAKNLRDLGLQVWEGFVPLGRLAQTLKSSERSEGKGKEATGERYTAE